MLKWAKWCYQKISIKNNSGSLQEPLLDETHRVKVIYSDKHEDEKEHKGIMVATATTLRVPKETHGIVLQYLGAGKDSLRFAITDKEHYNEYRGTLLTSRFYREKTNQKWHSSSQKRTLMQFRPSTPSICCVISSLTIGGGLFCAAYFVMPNELGRNRVLFYGLSTVGLLYIIPSGCILLRVAQEYFDPKVQKIQRFLNRMDELLGPPPQAERFLDRVAVFLGAPLPRLPPPPLPIVANPLAIPIDEGIAENEGGFPYGR